MHRAKKKLTLLRDRRLATRAKKAAPATLPVNALVFDAEDELLRYRDAARLLGMSPGTLMVWVCTRRYDLPFFKVGRSVLFRRSELLAWLETRRRGGSQLAPTQVVEAR